MTPLTGQNEPISGMHFDSQMSPGRNSNTVDLKPATYVKVIDLATMNHLDVEKIKMGTETHLAEGEDGIMSLSSTASSDQKGVRGVSNPKYQKRVLPSSQGFNLCLLVGNIRVVVEKTRVDMSQVRLAECEVGDETGTVSLRCRDNQIATLQEISEQKGAVILRNCNIELYQGKFIRLGVNKWGKISPYPDLVESTPKPPEVMNKSLNLSIVDVNEIFDNNWSRILDGTSLPPEHSNPDPNVTMWKDSKTNHSRKGAHLYNKMKPNLDNRMAGPRGYPQFYPNSSSYIPYSQSRMEPLYQHEQQAMMAFQHQYNMQLQLENMHYYQGHMVHNTNQIYTGSHSTGTNIASPGNQYHGTFPDYSFRRGLEYPSQTSAYDYYTSPAMSPSGRVGSSNVSFSESDDFSIRQQESPMMNPNLPPFSPNFAMPNFSLSNTQASNFDKSNTPQDRNSNKTHDHSSTISKK